MAQRPSWDTAGAIGVESGRHRADKFANFRAVFPGLPPTVIKSMCGLSKKSAMSWPYCHGNGTGLDTPILAVAGHYTKLVFVRSAGREGMSPDCCHLFEIIRMKFFDPAEQWDIPALRLLLDELLPRNGEFNDFLVENNFPNLGRRDHAAQCPAAA